MSVLTDFDDLDEMSTARCKKCINSAFCKSISHKDPDCDFFKNNEVVTTLPCELNKTVYLISPLRMLITKCKVVEFRYNGAFIIVLDNGMIMGGNVIGKHIFFDYNTAKNSLLRKEQ